MIRTLGFVLFLISILIIGCGGNTNNRALEGDNKTLETSARSVSNFKAFCKQQAEAGVVKSEDCTKAVNHMESVLTQSSTPTKDGASRESAVEACFTTFALESIPTVSFLWAYATFMFCTYEACERHEYCSSTDDCPILLFPVFNWAGIASCSLDE